MFFRRGKGAGRAGPAGERPGAAGGTEASPNGQAAPGGIAREGLRLPPSPAEPALQLDNRGLQPPEPMVRILSALDRLEPGQVLQAHNDRKPMFLLPHLDERGFEYAMAEQDDGSVIIRIWRAGAAPGPQDAAALPAGSEPPAQEVPGSAEPADPAGQPAAGGKEQDPGTSAAGAGVEPLVMDVRPYFARRQEPFRDIMANVARLKPGQPFVLIVGFEPVPLYWVMKRKGFEHRAERQPDGAWRVTFWRPE
ncbi:DUF2249 domain-containing protein [Thermaerobacter subterraneus]|uniref:DUF2249 domain-containing protein n=1 Tax=Thermaerobacter subterraneus DSM 13965 TaxID=867903 RepID=K6PRL8_9FIRM|nr:DUF2249 domain-containing protein [Thermaerobacter subterraneus]EKP95582.1 hypothetical protein ThesuDRAFT_01336 [Thermaerobacter subterraneus DSM 13965]